MTTLYISGFAPIFILYFLAPQIRALDITALLSPYPDLSDFAGLLASTAVASDLANRNGVTVLAVPNSVLGTYGLARCRASSSSVDALRNQILVQYIAPETFDEIAPTGNLVNTLLQATGRATGSIGSVNVTRDRFTGAVHFRSSAASNATVIANVTEVPHNVSVFSVDSLLIPCGSDLTASESRPSLGLNITKALIDAQDFNVAAAMLAASGVVQELEADEGGAGITMFMPIDAAFENSVSLQSLPADKKAVSLKFHVLHSYYPLGSLQSIVNPVQPTLATEDMGAGSFTLNISRLNGSVAINSGLVQASVTQTAFDQNPVAIFGISAVLLPKEIFGDRPTSLSPPQSGSTPSEDESYSPEESPPSQFSSPPGVREKVKSEAVASAIGVDGRRIFAITLCCLLALLSLSV